MSIVGCAARLANEKALACSLAVAFDLYLVLPPVSKCLFRVLPLWY